MLLYLKYIEHLTVIVGEKLLLSASHTRLNVTLCVIIFLTHMPVVKHEPKKEVLFYICIVLLVCNIYVELKRLVIASNLS